MRYHFRGLRRDTGKAVVGHVDADNEEIAYHSLADEGIVVETIVRQPRPQAPSSPGASGEQAGVPHIDREIESALDAGSKQVNFDDLSKRYQGKRVWVLDRDKMKHRVMKIVDTAVIQSQQESEGDDETRQRVAEALEGLFANQKNISSNISAEEAAAKAKPPPPAPEPAPQPQPAAPPNSALQEQIDRLSQVVEQMEGAITTLSRAAKRGGGGGGLRLRTSRNRALSEEQDAVLKEIFQTNLTLRGRNSSQNSSEDNSAQPTG